MLRTDSHQRTLAQNRQLAWTLAYVAGAVNAGGFLAIGWYTSHMTGILSTVADKLALGELQEALAAGVILACFILGAALSTTLITFGRRRRLRSRYAVALILQALLLLLFGYLGARHVRIAVHQFNISLAVLLSLIMGMQNATVTKISGASVRTTHMTGIMTDLGIELSRLFYINVREDKRAGRVVANRDRLRLHGLILFAFFNGAILGVLGFKYIGFGVTIPIALFLLILAAEPVADEVNIYRRALKRRRRLAPCGGLRREGAYSSAFMNRSKRGRKPRAGSTEATTRVAWPRISERGTKPKNRESKLLSRLSPITR